MRLHGRMSQGRFSAAVVLVAIIIVAMMLSSGLLLKLVDDKLSQSADEQVIRFTEQATLSVSDRMHIINNVLASFTVESADCKKIRPALASMQERFDFAAVAFAGLDGQGCYADGTPFTTASLPVPETALAQEMRTYSQTHVAENGEWLRLGQSPLYLEGQLCGALYVEIPVEQFSTASTFETFDGAGTFVLFDATTEKIIVQKTEKSPVPVTEDMTVYDLLRNLQQIGGKDGSPRSESQTEQDRAALVQMQQAVAGNNSGLFTSDLGGEQSYVCIAPVNVDSWYVCTLIPVESVRTEYMAVMTTFQLAFGLVITCLVAVLLLFYAFYRRRTAEKGVEMKTALYGALSENIDMAVNMYSPDDKTVTPIVKKAQQVIGYPMNDLMGNRKIADKIGLSESGRNLLARVRNNEIIGHEQGEFTFRDRKTARNRWAEYSVDSFVFEGKRQILVVFRDISKSKALEHSMKDAMVAAESANKAKSDFLSRMSHEIRTPMNAIVGMTHIARNNLGSSEKVASSLDKIEVASDHLLTIINDVLDISKIESGKMILSTEAFSLSAVVDQITEGLKEQFDSRSQKFSVVRSGLEEDRFLGDETRLRQMVINLLANASKYTPDGGHVTFEVSLRPSKIEKYTNATFVIADDGIGMSEEFLDNHLFEPFAMEQRMSVQGTGLGMPIVKNIVTMLNGTILVESKPDEGTKFTVMLDLQRIPKEASPHATEEGTGGGALPDGQAAAAPGAGGDADLSGVRALLAEDNAINAEIVCELLAEEGVAVDWAHNGKEALEMFVASEAGYYDVVFMDIQMPVMDGYQATQEIRALARPDAAVAIIAMSANAFMDDIEASLRCGMNAHLSKPIDMREVVATIAKELGR